MGSLAGSERLDACDGPSEDESMNVMSACTEERQSRRGVLSSVSCSLQAAASEEEQTHKDGEC